VFVSQITKRRLPNDRALAGLVVYGGDLFTTARSEWRGDPLQERPYDVDYVLNYFDQANTCTARNASHVTARQPKRYQTLAAGMLGRVSRTVGTDQSGPRRARDP
jgi:hypothetical protein